MADDVERRIIYLEVNASKAVDGSTAATRALAAFEKGAASAGGAVDALEAATASAGGAASRAALDLAAAATNATGLSAAYRTTTGSVLELVKASAAVTTSAQAQAAGMARLAEQRTLQSSLAETRALMDGVARSTQSLTALYGSATVAVTSLASAESRHYQSSLAAAERYAQGVAGTVDKLKVAEAYQASLTATPQYGAIPAAVASSAAATVPGAAGRSALTANQRLMLGYQFNDVFTQLASGASPFTVAAQQGPQITQVFGGIGATLSAIPASLLAGGAAALGAGGLALAVQALKDINDALETQKRRLGDVIGDQRLAATAYGEIRANALAAGEAIDKTTARFEQFMRAGASLGTTTGQTGGLLTIFNELGKLGGANDNERSSAAGGLAQALKDSVVSASSLETILDNMPGLGRRIADGLGLSVTQLRLMASEGDLTNKQVFEGLLSQQAKVTAEFKEAGLTVGGFFEKAIQGAKDLAAWLYQIEITSNKTKLFQQSGPTAFPDRNKGSLLGSYGSLPNFPVSLEQQITNGEAGRFVDSAAQLQAQILDIGVAAEKAAGAAVLAGSKIADKLLPDFKSLQQQTDEVNKALDVLQKGFNGIDASRAAQETKRLTDALIELQQKTPYGQASMATGLREAQDALGMTAGQRAYAAKVDQLAGPGGGAASTEAAQGIVDKQQLQMLDDLIAKQQLELATQTAITQAMHGGKAAADDASVAMRILGISIDQLGNISPEAKERLDQLAKLMRDTAAEARAQASIDASKPLVAELNGIAAALKVVEQGAYAVKRAQAEARAAANDNGTGALEMQVFDAQQALTDATALDNLRKSIDLTNQLAAAAGDVARQKAIQLDYDIKQAQMAAGPGAAAAIAEKMRAQNAADLNRTMKEGIAAQQTDIDLAQQQLAIIRSGSPDMAAQLAMLQKRNDLLKQYGEAYADSPDGQKQVALAGTKARIDEQLQFEKDAADATKRSWQNAYDDIQSAGADAFYNIFNGAGFNAQSVADAMKQIFLRTFAEIAAAAVIRPLVTPIFQAGAAAGIIPGGVVPSATGSTGGVTSIGGLGSIVNLARNFGGSALRFLGLGGSAAASSSPYAFANLSGAYGGLGASAAPTASSFAGGAAAAIPVWGWIAAAASIAKSFTGGQPNGSPLGLVNTLIGPSLDEWQSNPMNSLATVALGPIAWAGLNALGFDPFGKKIPPMPGLGYVQGTFGFNSGGNVISSGQNAGDAANVGTGVLGLITASGGTPIAGKLYGGTIASGTTHTWNGSQWVGQDYTQANFTSPTGQTVPLAGTGAGVPLQQVADMLTSEVFRQDVLSGAIKGISDTLVKIFTSFDAGTVKATQDVLTFVKSYDQLGKATNTVKDTIDQLNQKFADLTTQAQTYGVSLEPIDTELAKQTKRTAQDFIDNMLDPIAVQMRALDDAQASALESAKYINDNIAGVYADTNKIVDYYGKQRLALEDQFYGGAITNLKNLIKSLEFGNLSNASPLTTMEGLRSNYAMTLGQAVGGDSTAISGFSDVASQLATFGQQFYASGPQYEALRQQIIADAAHVSAVASGGSAVTTATGTTSNIDPQINALLSQMSEFVATSAAKDKRIDDLTEQVAELSAQISRYAQVRG